MDLRRQQSVFGMLAAGLLGLAAVLGWAGCKKDETTGDTSAPGPEPPKCDNGEEYGGGKPHPCGRDIGEECAAGAECKTDHCADGRCCDEACDAVCSFCEGFCARAPEGEDPRAECAPSPASACTVGGFCDGLGACAQYAITGPSGELVRSDGVPLTDETAVLDMAAEPGRVALIARWGFSANCELGHDYLLIFDETAAGWVESARFDVTFPQNDCFGRRPPTVALAGDRVAVGTVSESGKTGFARVYEKEGAEWIFTTLPAPTPQGGDGFAVAIQGDTLFSGEPNKALVHPYRKVAGTWTLEPSIPSPSGLSGGFGAALSVSGTRLLVGGTSEKKAYVLELSGGAWSASAELGPSEDDVGSFGTSVLLSGSTALVVGRRPGTQAAWVDVFTLTSGTWTLSGTLRPFGAILGIEDGSYERFADHLALHGDTLLVGGDRQVFFYQRSGDTFVPLSKTLRKKNDEAPMPVAFAGDVAFTGGRWHASPCEAP